MAGDAEEPGNALAEHLRGRGLVDERPEFEEVAYLISRAQIEVAPELLRATDAHLRLAGRDSAGREVLTVAGRRVEAAIREYDQRAASATAFIERIGSSAPADSYEWLRETWHRHGFGGRGDDVLARVREERLLYDTELAAARDDVGLPDEYFDDRDALGELAREERIAHYARSEGQRPPAPLGPSG